MIYLQKHKNFIGFILGLVLLVGLFPNSVIAQGGSQVITIDLAGDHDYPEDLLKDRTLYFWALDPKDLSENDPQALVTKYEAMSLEDLGQPVAKGVADPGNKYQITLDLEDGVYYAREVQQAPREGKISSFFFQLPVKDGVIQPKWVFPEKTGRVQLLKYESTPQGKKSPLAGVEFDLYSNSAGQPTKVAVEKAGTIYVYKEGGQPIPLVTDASGIIEVDKLPPGQYFFKETKPLPGYALLKQDITFTVKPGETANLEVENFKEGQEGGFQFLKHDPDKKPLAGAKFALTVKGEDGEYKHVQINGQNVVLTSGPDGKFSVTGLQYGTYYLWETQAPEGFAKLTEPLVFVVDKESSTKLMFIENKPGPPPPRVDSPPKKPGTPPEGQTPPEPNPPRVDSAPKGGLPNTGDISIIIMSITGLILIGIGRHLIREEEYN